MIKSEKIKIIKELAFFKELKEETINILAKEATINKFQKNKTLYNQGEDCESIDVIIKGNLIAYYLSEKGSSTIICKFEKNRIIGGNILFNEDKKYPLNIYCQSSCTLLNIKRDTEKKLLNDYNFAFQFILFLSQNSNGLKQKIQMHTYKTLRENISSFLKKQSLIQNNQTIILPFSKKELANYFGVQRQSLFRELKKMKDENLIYIDNKRIKLLKKFYL